MRARAPVLSLRACWCACAKQSNNLRCGFRLRDGVDVYVYVSVCARSTCVVLETIHRGYLVKIKRQNYAHIISGIRTEVVWALTDACAYPLHTLAKSDAKCAH